MRYGNCLDDLPTDKAKRDFFRGYFDVKTPECQTGIVLGEIACYRVACHAPEMIPFMPKVVQDRLPYYGSHLNKCETCLPFFTVIETSGPMKFKNTGAMIQ